MDVVLGGETADQLRSSRRLAVELVESTAVKLHKSHAQIRKPDIATN